MSFLFVGKEFDKQDGGCTSIGITRERALNGEALCAHNWDWKTSQRANMVAMKIHQKNGNRPFYGHGGGYHRKDRFNSAGLNVYLNALSTDQAPSGLPAYRHAGGHGL